LIERRRTADEEKEIIIMALTRKMLKAMGIEDDKIDQIIEAHSETVDALKDEREKFREAAEKLPGVQSELETLKTSGGNWKEKYEKEHSDFESYKADVSAKEAGAAKESAYRTLLAEVGVDPKRIDTVIRAEKAGFADLKIGADGKFEGADELTNTIKANWGDFIPVTTTTGVPTAKPPANTGGMPMTKKDIDAIKDPEKRQAAIAEHIDLYRKG
jgi:hypothetical protein